MGFINSPSGKGAKIFDIEAERTVVEWLFQRRSSTYLQWALGVVVEDYFLHPTHLEILGHMKKELDDEAKCKPSVQSFKKYLNSFIWTPGHSFFGIRDKFEVKLLTKIRVGFSDLRDNRFDHNFNCASPTCQCGSED